MIVNVRMSVQWTSFLSANTTPATNLDALKKTTMISDSDMSARVHLAITTSTVASFTIINHTIIRSINEA